MTSIELLRKSAKDLARKLDAASEPQLRRVAAAMAQAAVARTGLSHPDISETLALLEDCRSPHPQLRVRLAALTDQLDEECLQLQESEEDGDEKDPAALDAFAKARASAAVAAALGENATAAAAEAAYEAIAATNDIAYLTSIAEKILAI